MKKIEINKNLIIDFDKVEEIILKENNGIADKIIFEMPEIKMSKIDSVYTGKIGCRCGCLGTYTTPEESPSFVEDIINKLKKNAKNGITVIKDEIKQKDYIYDFRMKTKVYTLYLKV